MWPSIKNFLRNKVFTRENLISLALCMMLILIVIFTTDASPQWIYQGF